MVVSVPAVSKVVNGRADVAADTRSRIESLLAAYDYAAPRRAAGAAHRPRLHRAQPEGRRDHPPNTLSEIPTDGVILVLTELSPSARAGLAALRVPIVTVDPVGQPDPHIPSIGAANWAGGLMATEHPLSLGHRRVGRVTGEPSLMPRLRIPARRPRRAAAPAVTGA
jgi:DNA-binding LacI/PurR family transcriptional regulator